MALVQKIYDSGLQKFVYYTKSVVDTAPAANETEPEHTNNLVTATHSVVAETGATLSVYDEGDDRTFNTRSINFVGDGVSSTANGDEVTVTITGSGSLGAHATTHLSGEDDEINGDQLDIDFSPPTYTPSLVGGITTSTQHLTSHLKGIDNYLAGLSLVAGEANTAANVGSGAGVFKDKTSVQLNFKSIVTGYGVTVTPNTNDITVASRTTVSALVSGGTIAINADNGPHYELVLNENAVLLNPTNSATGKSIEIVVAQNGTGGNLLSLDSDWVPVGKTFQIAQEPNSVSIVKAVARGVSAKWYYTIEHSEYTQVTASDISSNLIAWNPQGRGYASLIRVSADNDLREIHGILAPTAGSEQISFRFVITGTNRIVLRHDNSNALSTNRLYITGESDITLSPHDSAGLLYDFTSQRWRLV